MDKFKRVIYTKSYEDYQAKKNVFLVSAKDVQVRANKQYVLLEDQFLNNWDSCHKMWVAFHRKNLPTLGDNTNNRIERSFLDFETEHQSKISISPFHREECSSPCFLLGLQTDKKKPRKRKNTESLNRQSGVKKRKTLGSNDNCPVFDERLIFPIFC